MKYKNATLCQGLNFIGLYNFLAGFIRNLCGGRNLLLYTQQNRYFNYHIIQSDNINFKNSLLSSFSTSDEY